MIKVEKIADRVVLHRIVDDVSNKGSRNLSETLVFM